jgi:hypothetical protein
MCYAGSDGLLLLLLIGEIASHNHSPCVFDVACISYWLLRGLIDGSLELVRGRKEVFVRVPPSPDVIVCGGKTPSCAKCGIVGLRCLLEASVVRNLLLLVMVHYFLSCLFIIYLYFT